MTGPAISTSPVSDSPRTPRHQAGRAKVSRVSRAMVLDALARGWSQRQAARAWGVSAAAVCKAARREGVTWPSLSEAARRAWADPEKRQARIEAISEAMRRALADPEKRKAWTKELSEAQRRAWADPEKRQARIEAISEAMRRAWADPEKRKAWTKELSEAQRRAWADPEKRKTWTKALSEAQRRAWDNPARNPLLLLTAAERADYDTLRRCGGYSREDALRAVGRPDLIVLRVLALAGASVVLPDDGGEP